MPRQSVLDREIAKYLRQERGGVNDYRRKCTRSGKELINLLRREPNFDLCREFIGGSMGKRTSLGWRREPDIDFYLYFHPTSGASQKEMAELIKLKLDVIYEVATRGENKRRYRVNFKTEFAVSITDKETKTKIDLMPAFCFGEHGNGFKRHQFEAIQRLEMEAGKNLTWLNSSSATLAVSHIKRQHQFYHDMIIMAKRWNILSVKAKNFSGRSLIIELIALKAAQIARETQRNATRGKAFKVFLQLMAEEFRNINIQFEEVLDDFEVQDVLEQKMDDWAAKKGSVGVLVDLSMPYRNLLENKTVKAEWPRFQEAAEKSLRLIRTGRQEEAIGQ